MSSQEIKIQFEVNGSLSKSSDGTVVICKAKGLLQVFASDASRRVTINPTTKLITNGKREIPFTEVEKMDSVITDLPSGVDWCAFYIYLKTGEKIELGTISGKSDTLYDRQAQILTILREAINQ